MRKIYSLAAFVFCAVIANAQTQCDTINMPIPSNWTMQSYQSLGFFGFNGYISGINSDNFTQQADYFDLSSTSYSYLLGVMIKFTKANTNQDSNISKPIYFRLYNDNNGVPGTEITNAQTRGQKTLSQIKSDVAGGKISGINFPSAIPLPASKKFYVAVDLSNFKWFSPEGHYDSICIASTGDNETINTAWNYDSDAVKWKPYPKVWDTPPNDLEPLDVTLYIFPYVGTTQGGCGILPVKLVSFTAERNESDVKLKWQVANEINMKGYEVEKANNDNVFKSFAFIPAYNDMKAENYTATDKNAFVNSQAVQYRLKQIDRDGSVEYSKIIALKYDHSAITFANPFSGTLNLQLNISSPQTVSINLYDIKGKLVAIQKPAVYNTSTRIDLSVTENLKAGNYILKITSDNETYTYKVVKQ